MTSFKNLSEGKFLNIIIILTIVIFFLKIFIFYEHYPLHDELIVLDRYLEWKNFLRKDHIGNHTITSFLGVLIKSIFGYNFEILRFTSFICFVLILIIFRLMYDKLYLYLIFIGTIVSSNILFNYMYIFRGYYVHALLVVTLFYFLKKYFNEEKKNIYINSILILIFAQLAHSMFTIYVAIPALLVLLIDNFKNKEISKYYKNYLIFLIIPTLSIYLLYFFLDGFVTLYSSNLNFDFLFKNLFTIFIPCVSRGFEMMFSSGYTSSSFSALNATVYILNFGYDQILGPEPIFLIIYVLSLSIALYNIIKFKNIRYLDLLILLIFAFYIIIFKSPPLRVHVGTVMLCTFFILDNCNKTFINYKLQNIKAYLFACFVCISLLVISVSPNEKFQQVKKEVINIEKNLDNCLLANEKLTSYEKWILINYFPEACRYKYDGKIQDNYLY